MFTQKVYYKYIFITNAYIIYRLFEDRKGSYHARDGLKRDVGYAVLPINQYAK